MSHDLGQPECNFAKNLEDGPSLAYFACTAIKHGVVATTDAIRQIISIFF